MTKDEALDLALEALEYRALGVTSGGKDLDDRAITAIKQARALDKKAENARELGLDYEPHKGLSEHMAQATNGRVRIDPVTGDVGIGTPEAQPAPVQEPVAWVCYGAPGKRDIDFEEADINKLPIGTQLYTTPPAQRQWVGLTDEERTEIRREHYARTLPLMDAVEAKLKEKNT